MVDVIAYEIDEKHIRYKCPFCYTLSSGRITDKAYNPRTFTLYKSAKPNIHTHGSCGELHNRIETRSSHCTFNNEQVNIHITDETKRPFGNNVVNFFKNYNQTI